MQFDFKDQTAIVSGGTRGIGRAVSEAFLQAGAKVLATYYSNRDSAEKFLQDNKEHSERLSIHGFDVAKPEEVERFFQETPDAGNFQILVHSAGIRADAIVGLMKSEEWSRVIDTNLGGTFNMCKFAVQNLSRKRYGRTRRHHLAYRSIRHGRASQLCRIESRASGFRPVAGQGSGDAKDYRQLRLTWVHRYRFHLRPAGRTTKSLFGHGAAQTLWLPGGSGAFGPVPGIQAGNRVHHWRGSGSQRRTLRIRCLISKVSSKTKNLEVPLCRIFSIIFHTVRPFCLSTV